MNGNRRPIFSSTMQIKCRLTYASQLQDYYSRYPHSSSILRLPVSVKNSSIDSQCVDSMVSTMRSRMVSSFRNIATKLPPSTLCFCSFGSMSLHTRVNGRRPMHDGSTVSVDALSFQLSLLSPGLLATAATRESIHRLVSNDRIDHSIRPCR